MSKSKKTQPNEFVSLLATVNLTVPESQIATWDAETRKTVRMYVEARLEWAESHDGARPQKPYVIRHAQRAKTCGEQPTPAVT